MMNVVNEYEYVEFDHITKRSYQEKLLKLVKTYKPNKTKYTGLKMVIIVADEMPICQRPRRFPITQKKIIEKQFQEWLKDGINRQSFSDYAPPVVLTKKTDWLHILCIDCKKTEQENNKKTIPFVFNRKSIR